MSDLGKRYLYNGVLLRCDKGTIPTPFTVLPRPSRIRGQFQAHELDRVPLVNIKPFGACALKYGSPCLPMAPQWTQVHQGALRLGPAHAHPLLETSVCQCKLGGRITPLMAPLLPTVAGLEPIPGVTPLYGPDPVAPPDPNAGDATAHEVAEGFKWAALGLAVLGAGLAIAGCFFPPLELAAGASFEAALAASASTAFVAADASLAIGVGIDLAVAEVHPSPANQAVVVGDLVGLALGYGAGKAIGAAVSKFGPAVVEAFAQRAAKEALPEVDPATVYHFKSNAYVQSLLDEINPKYFGQDTRYGAGLYVAQHGQTAIAEVTYHGGDPAVGKVIRYEMDMSQIKALDMTDPATAKAYGADAAFAHEAAVEAKVAAKRAEGVLSDKELGRLEATKYAGFQEIGARAQAEGYNAVKFPSVRGEGYNYVIYSESADFMNQVMKPQMVMPAVK